MAVVTDKIKSVVDFLVKGFEPRETIFDEMAQEADEDYQVQDNLAIDPAYSYQPVVEKPSELKVVNHPSFNKGYEVKVMEPRSFEDAATIVQHLRNRKTIVLNLHLLDKEQSQRTIDFVCGASHALNGTAQKISDMVFIFTPSNVSLSVENGAVQSKFAESLWNKPL